MLPKESLKDLLSRRDLSSTDKLLIIVSTESESGKAVKDIRSFAIGAGNRTLPKLNISDLLGKAKEYAVRTPSGWELTTKGLQHVSRIVGPAMGAPAPVVASALRSHLVKIADSGTQSFLEEAVKCFEHRNYRAAVVLSWVGAVAVLYDHIIKNELAAFNAEAIARTATSKSPWQKAKTADDLARMKESEFLVVLEKISIFGKSVKKELEKCLDFRNGCGHPNSLDLGENMVAAHVEFLILNVFSKF